MKRKYIIILILVVASVLRLWRISSVPVSLFGDELDVGYQAYSVLNTGRDYYGNLLPFHFHSLAEWRTPLYLYSSVPTVALFGISPLGVRLPAAIFGILGVYMIYLLVKERSGDDKLALITAGVLALSPWHIQYSRAAFEVTELLFFLLLGIWAFYRSFKNGRWLAVSMVSFALTPWIYSTAKVFTPILLVFLFVYHFKSLVKLNKKHLVAGALALILVGVPISYSTVFGGGAERFGYVSVFSDPTTEPEVGTARLNDARVRGDMGEGLSPTVKDRILHNKFVYWSDIVIANYINAYSTNFLFTKGDPNLRHSIEGMGQLYRIEIVALIFGLILFFSRKQGKGWKEMVGFWLLAGVLPSSLTRDGGNHATRLILILPPLTILVSYGIYWVSNLLNGWKKVLFICGYGGLFFVNFVFYQHDYWVHNPWYSERWWHAGFEDAVKSAKRQEGNYDRIVFSTANEPPWVFFAAWYEYPPREWQENFPLDNVVELEGFGEVSHIGKYYFGTLDAKDVYEMGKQIDDKTLYVATEKEVKVNLIQEPDRVPKDLELVKSVAYPSGEPAFYLLTGKKND